MKFIKLTGERAASLVAEITAGRTGKALAAEFGISYVTVWKWSRYAGLTAKWLIHVKEQERRIKYLKRALSKVRVQVRASVDVIKRLEPSRKRRALFASAVQVGHGLSRHHANEAVGLSSVSRALKTMRDKDAALAFEMRCFLSENPGVGFRSMFDVLLRDRGFTRYHAQEIYREEILTLQNRKTKPALPKRIMLHRPIIAKRDAVWAIDYMHFKLSDQSRVSILNGIDEFTRECVFSVACNQSGTRPMITAMERMLRNGRKPKAIRTDNSRDFTSERVVGWCRAQRIAPMLISLQCPRENAFVERFNGTLRREVLNWYDFETLKVLQRMLDDFRIRYNVGRPHSAHGGLSPLQFIALSAPRKQDLADLFQGLTPGPRRRPRKPAGPKLHLRG